MEAVIKVARDNDLEVEEQDLNDIVEAVYLNDDG
jgi:hypothetical protein